MEIVGVIDFGPRIALDNFRVDTRLPHVNQHSKDQLVIAVVIDETRIKSQQPVQLSGAKLTRKFINVQRLVFAREQKITVAAGAVESRW